MSWNATCQHCRGRISRSPGVGNRAWRHDDHRTPCCAPDQCPTCTDEGGHRSITCPGGEEPRR